MKIIYKPGARKSIAEVADYIESLNTPGSGERWAVKLAARIETLARSKAKFALCNHPSLAKFNYSCYAYHDWVIAFKVTSTKFEVRRFILGSRLA
jgi:hypothetical protein